MGCADDVTGCATTIMASAAVLIQIQSLFKKKITQTLPIPMAAYGKPT